MGIAQGAILDYWTKRGERYANDRVWGPGAGTPEQHAAQVEERAAFIFEACPTDVRTLDYGCGIGMYTPYFPPEEYVGVDLSQAHMRLAREANPGHYFIQIASPVWSEPFSWAFDLFFTATVLQHCSDEVVDGLFKNLSLKRPGTFSLSLYEFATPTPDHRQTVGRLPEQYIEMVAKWFAVIGTSSRTHTIHGALCAHTMIDVEGL